MPRPRNLRPVPPRHRQRGVSALFVTLVVLLVMMILGITASLLSGTQFRLASNLQFENIAFNRAESAANTAHSWLVSGKNFADSGFTTRVNGGLYPVGTLTTDPLTMTWTPGTNSVAVTSGDDTAQYVIEKLASNQRDPDESPIIDTNPKHIIERACLYRITARGTSAKGTVRFIQTMYTMKYAYTPSAAAPC